MNNSIENTAAPLRARLKQRRAAQNAVDSNRGALLIRGRLYTWLATTRTRLREEGRRAPENIAAFWAMEDEPALQPLLQQWVEEEGYRVSLPVVTTRDAPLEFRLWTPEASLRAGAYGIMEPVGEPAPPPDIILVPTLGYTRQGDRVGYGKGYYDRTLAALKAQGHVFTAIGIAWATGDLSGEGYTPAAHDFQLDAILTDKGWAKPAPVL
ncbi:5-formyltetrahydrofolate cyclo-ligase [Parapusillimonas granuli]|uniref:5-formyltetrahydrofolate cyclo-ligase n=1 Tax=Parapusillimonas granuli TaxID=380911 RepID=A0A853G205_9BURK|nr:5-formyltetrahydrofolate cyclo-ligase [Parapusillimonas granuli]MBB5215441.1 5-formyltetrahydrofolate cyclo-ligase [Parapusillimonas granuli]MEB2400278.1 5-formyltetrahydrofolate cyclo-ligase [Alcaligenaceae bacterium]NYT49892.1 5-formyltetrahydrofolate cyclo-ligase [Parapusillimonas granuli]